MQDYVIHAYNYSIYVRHNCMHKLATTTVCALLHIILRAQFSEISMENSLVSWYKYYITWWMKSIYLTYLFFIARCKPFAFLKRGGERIYERIYIFGELCIFRCKPIKNIKTRVHSINVNVRNEIISYKRTKNKIFYCLNAQASWNFMKRELVT